MSNNIVKASNPWGIATEKFFYYYMGLRKGDMRKQVALMQSRFPDDSPERLARRFIAAQVPLSMIGSALVHLPSVIPVFGPASRILGLASGTTAMMILNMTLALQIGLIYGYDIDDRARLKELMAIIATTGIASSSTLLIPQLSELSAELKAISGGAVIITTAQLVGEIAIKYYGRNQGLVPAPVPGTEASAN